MTEQHALRADAERRRRRILDAAARVFSEEGLDAPMERVARAADVGVGTLYRRFPDRTALVLAVTQDNLEQVVETTREAMASSPTAWEALLRVLEGPGYLRVVLRPLVPVPPPIAEAVRLDPAVRALRRQMLDHLTQIVTAAQAEGTMRTDVGPGDVALLFGMLRRRPVVAPEVAAAAGVRARGLVADALRARPGSDGDDGALAGEPLTVADLGFDLD